MSDAGSASATPKTSPQAEREEEAPKKTDVEDDPALFIIYNDEAVHESLGRPNAPVQQQGTVAASSAAFQRYVYDVLITTGMEENENCVQDMTAKGRGTYFPFVLHRLQQDQYRAALDKLLDHFVLAGTPVSAWSQAVPAPLGKLLGVTQLIRPLLLTLYFHSFPPQLTTSKVKFWRPAHLFSWTPGLQ